MSFWCLPILPKNERKRFDLRYHSKVHIFWEGHKYIWLLLHRTNLRWRFHKLLWPSQNIWNLLTLSLDCLWKAIKYRSSAITLTHCLMKNLNFWSKLFTLDFWKSLFSGLLRLFWILLKNLIWCLNINYFSN